MAEVNAIIAAWRGYEYPPDRIRLQTLMLPAVMAAIQDTFQFRRSGVGLPPATFGPPPQEVGLVFQLGVLSEDSGPDISIRDLYFEPRRVAICVGGPSSAIDRVWSKLRQLLAQLPGAGKDPVLPEPQAERDFSELNIRLRIPIQSLVAPQLVEASREAVGEAAARQDVFVPAIHAVFVKEAASYVGDFPGGQIGPQNVWTLSLRAGTMVSPGQEFYSAAPLASDAHVAFLNKLESAIASS